MNEAQIYKALGDPVRLEMVMRLANASPCSIGELTRDLGISRQGARKQLGVLESASIVRLKPVGRETRVVLDVGALQAARDFISQMERQWDKRLEALKDFVENELE